MISFNVRDTILKDISKLIGEDSASWSSVGLSISTDIGAPIFDESDLPLLHINFGDESVSEYLMNDPYTDMRKSNISMHYFIGSYEKDGKQIPFIEKGDKALSEGSAYMEGIAARTDEIMKKYRFMYPRRVVKIVLLSVGYAISKESDPKVGRILMEYEAQYQVSVKKR